MTSLGFVSIQRWGADTGGAQLPDVARFTSVLKKQVLKER